MKIQGSHVTGFALATAISVVFSTATLLAQDLAAPAPVVTASTVAPSLSPAASQILQLSQAKISDGTIITFIQNSGSSYGLDASQIVYLKQQGVSDPVLNAMLNQRTALAAMPTPQTPPDNSAQAVVAPPTAVVAQPATPAPSVVVVPDTQTYDYDAWAYPYYYSYPYYYGWPTVYWGWGWHGGYGGWHGDWHDGYHGSAGGFHPGVSGGFHGGGFGGGFHGGGGFHH